MDAAERDALVKAVRDGLAADVNSGRLAKDIAEEMAKRPAGVTGVLKNAGEAIGLIVGVVALAYVFGGVVILLRLITDHSNAEQAVAVIGGLPRELVITLGFVEVLGSAALVGLVAAVIAAAAGKPTFNRQKENLREPWWLVPVLVISAAVATVGFRALLVAQIDWERWMLVSYLAAFVLTVACLLAGWRALRLSGGDLPHRASRALLVGVVFTIVAVPLTLASAAALPFERVKLCVTGYEHRQSGRLIALTTDAAVIVREVGDRRRQITTLPGDAVTRADSGNLDALPGCPQPDDKAPDEGASTTSSGAGSPQRAVPDTSGPALRPADLRTVQLDGEYRALVKLGTFRESATGVATFVTAKPMALSDGSWHRVRLATNPDRA